MYAFAKIKKIYILAIQLLYITKVGFTPQSLQTSYQEKVLFYH